MASKVVLITGANTGIGYETVKALMESDVPYTILLGSRNPANADKAIAQLKAEQPNSKSTVHPLQVDVTDDASISAAYEKVAAEQGKVDCLVNNAGASFESQITSGQLGVREGWAKSWDVNVTGAHIMTSTFVPLLLKSSEPRLLYVSSGTSSLQWMDDDPDAHPNKAPAAGWPKKDFRSIISYRTAKIGNNMLMKEWQKVLKNDGVKCFCVSPGFLATGLDGVGADNLKKIGAGDPSQGGISLRKVIQGDRDADAGKVVRNYATPVQPY